MRIKYLLSILAFLSIVGWGPFSLFSFLGNQQTSFGNDDWMNQVSKSIESQADNLDPAVLKVSLEAYEKARKLGLDDKQLLTIIDYSKPSTERRLWVVDLKRVKVLFNTWVAHGKNSGEMNSTSFSNEPNSLKSSFGVFVTNDTYTGNDGYSLRIQGLERGINDNAYRRKIVFHGAAYVGEEIAKKYGMLGRSWGCMAVSKDTVGPLINTIKNHTLVVAYYPDNNWLKRSTFLT